jgi:hypothetical protein
MRGVADDAEELIAARVHAARAILFRSDGHNGVHFTRPLREIRVLKNLCFELHL